MPCTSPITGWRSAIPNPKTGKRPIVFNPSEGYKDMEVTVPCGRCQSCRLEHSRQWAVRCMHEASMHKQNTFITLTYNNENLPKDLSITKRELQNFFKRLRKNTGIKFKYFACGEYGDENKRPHYHAILFGIDFEDKQLHSKSKNGDLYYTSKTLEKAWSNPKTKKPIGFAIIGDVTFQSAAYVARYVMKKRKGDDDQIDPKTGKTNKEYYMRADENGELHIVEPEFCLMSRGSGREQDTDLFRYGIGRAWLEKYKNDTDKDFITINGNKMRLPKYYDSVLEAKDEMNMLERKLERSKKIQKSENTLERLAVKDEIVKTRINQLKRDI